MVGKTLSHYVVLEKLGAGGMGEVYLAEDTTLKRRVAIKVLPAALASNRERLERLRREAESLAALNHPNIVQIYSVERDQDSDFLTMELVEGASLSDAIPSGGLPLERFFAVAIPLTDALAAAHAQGVIHRDLKPGNVMLTDEGRVKVLDFGLAKLVPSEAANGGATAVPTISLETEPGTVMGTVGYMSPEQVRGEPLDHRSDLFSLGAVLHEMLTGERAFDARSGPDVLSAILRDSPQPVDARRPELPHHLGRIVRRCLEKSPDRRYPSARDLHHELEDLSQEIATERILEEHQHPEDTSPVAKGIRWPLVATGVAAVIIAILLGFQLVRRDTEEPQPAEIPHIESIAVLPFDNLMRDPEQDYFVEGMHEALITDLSKISALRVISRTSTVLYRDSDKSLPDIARELGVDGLIEGSVLRADGQVRVTAQLIDGTTDQHLWAESYDRELENILALLSDVAQAIAREIEITVTPGQERLLTAAQPVNPEAYELFLKGRHFFNRGDIAGFREALAYFQQAVDLDPEGAEGWAALAGAYFVHGFFDLSPASEMIPKSRAAANRALELDESQGGAHASLGAIALYYDWNWSAAERELQLALELDPTAVMVHHGYADYLAVMGDCEGSVNQVLEGRRHDPLGTWANLFVVGHLMGCGHYGEAVDEGRNAIDSGIEKAAFRVFIGNGLWLQGHHEQALMEWRELYGADDSRVQVMERGYAEAGPRGAMLARAETLVAAADTRPIDPFSVAAFYAAAGEADAAFEWLELTFEQRSPRILHLTINPFFNSIRSDPRYQNLLRRIGIPNASG